MIEAPQETVIDDEFAKSLGLESLEKLKEAARERLTAEFAGATRQRVKRMLLDRLDETHRFEAPPSLVDEEFQLMWNSIKSEMESSGKTFADEDTTEEAAQEEYRKIADRRVRLGLVLSEIGEKNKITVTDDEVSRAVIERARSMPGREKEVWDYYRNNANALAQLRAPIYEDKVVDFILELANVTDKKVTREELFKDDDDKAAGLILDQAYLTLMMNGESGPGDGSPSLGAASANQLELVPRTAGAARSCHRRIGPYLWACLLKKPASRHSALKCLEVPASRDVRPRRSIPVAVSVLSADGCSPPPNPKGD